MRLGGDGNTLLNPPISCGRFSAVFDGFSLNLAVHTEDLLLSVKSLETLNNDLNNLFLDCFPVAKVDDIVSQGLMAKLAQRELLRSRAAIAYLGKELSDSLRTLVQIGDAALAANFRLIASGEQKIIDTQDTINSIVNNLNLLEDLELRLKLINH